MELDALPPFPRKILRGDLGGKCRFQRERDAYRRATDAQLITALRARLKLAVDALEQYQARCDDLAHDEGQWHHGAAACPVEARIAAIIEACREPS